jgi:hypothetical protein
VLPVFVPEHVLASAKTSLSLPLKVSVGAWLHLTFETIRSFLGALWVRVCLAYWMVICAPHAKPLRVVNPIFVLALLLPVTSANNDFDLSPDRADIPITLLRATKGGD